jgi:C-terminal processing protease CtpA/Prc
MITKTPVMALAALLTIAAVPTSAEESDAQTDALQAEYQSMIEESERARSQAEAARDEAARAADRARELARLEAGLARERAVQRAAENEELTGRERERQHEEMERIREELARAHRELREAQREIARAHRDLERDSHRVAKIRRVNLGDRPVIGVVLGAAGPDGIEIVGVSPDGPAERAGLLAGDVLVSIGGQSLAAEDHQDRSARKALFRVMDEAAAGETLDVVVKRGDQAEEYQITAERREPSSWQSMLRIPGAPGAPGMPGAPQVLVEEIEIPPIDDAQLNEDLRSLNRRLQRHKFLHVVPGEQAIEIEKELILKEGLQADLAEYSELAEQAMREANIWFGLPHAQGLELAEINPGLGAYFKTERGVLVTQAREDNAYQLQAGDVVLKVGEQAVDSPSDMMRALRDIEPGSEVEIAIMRDRKARNLNVVMPENRLGFRRPLHRGRHAEW